MPISAILAAVKIQFKFDLMILFIMNQVFLLCMPGNHQLQIRHCEFYLVGSWIFCIPNIFLSSFPVLGLSYLLGNSLILVYLVFMIYWVALKQCQSRVNCSMKHEFFQSSFWEQALFLACVSAWVLQLYSFLAHPSFYMGISFHY